MKKKNGGERHEEEVEGVVIGRERRRLYRMPSVRVWRLWEGMLMPFPLDQRVEGRRDGELPDWKGGGRYTW